MKMDRTFDPSDVANTPSLVAARVGTPHPQWVVVCDGLPRR